MLPGSHQTGTACPWHHQNVRCGSYNVGESFALKHSHNFVWLQVSAVKQSVASSHVAVDRKVAVSDVNMWSITWASRPPHQPQPIYISTQFLAWRVYMCDWHLEELLQNVATRRMFSLLWWLLPFISFLSSSCQEDFTQEDLAKKKNNKYPC